MPRTPLVTRYDAVVLTLTAAGIATLIVAEGTDLRRFSNTIGVTVFGLILWRVVSTWPQLTVLEHALALLLALSPLVSAIASYSLQSRTASLPDNPYLWAVVFHRACCVILVVYWTRWLGRRHSPFRRGVPHPD